MRMQLIDDAYVCIFENPCCVFRLLERLESPCISTAKHLAPAIYDLMKSICSEEEESDRLLKNKVIESNSTLLRYLIFLDELTRCIGSDAKAVGLIFLECC